MISVVEEVAEEMPEHQTSRGREFRNVSVEDREPMARMIVVARSQVWASNSDWNNVSFRRAIADKKSRYTYHAGRLSVDMNEAENIWWNMVYDDPSPARKNEEGLI